MDPVAALSLEGALHGGDTAIRSCPNTPTCPRAYVSSPTRTRPGPPGKALVTAIGLVENASEADPAPACCTRSRWGCWPVRRPSASLANVLKSVDGVCEVGPPNSSQLWRDLVYDAIRAHGRWTHLLGRLDGALRPGLRRTWTPSRATWGDRGSPHPACERPGGVVVAEAIGTAGCRSGRERTAPHHALDALHHLLPSECRTCREAIIVPPGTGTATGRDPSTDWPWSVMTAPSLRARGRTARSTGAPWHPTRR